MNILISMLRGVNLGPYKRIKMDALRELYESLGFRNPQTYVQSGNVLFKTSERSIASLAKRIEVGIEKTFGFHADVIVRTTADLKSVIARNPFATRSGIEPGKLLVTFLAGDPTSEARAKIAGIKCDSEELILDGRELFVYYPNGMGRSKLTPAVMPFAFPARLATGTASRKCWKWPRRCNTMANKWRISPPFATLSHGRNRRILHFPFQLSNLYFQKAYRAVSSLK